MQQQQQHKIMQQQQQQQQQFSASSPLEVTTTTTTATATTTTATATRGGRLLEFLFLFPFFISPLTKLSRTWNRQMNQNGKRRETILKRMKIRTSTNCFMQQRNLF